MDIHEHQAKQLLARNGVPIPAGALAHSADEAVARAREVGGSVWAVKAQVHSGARGKAGGIKICRNEAEVAAAAEALIGETLVTIQTGPRGKLISSLYIESGTDIDRECYLSFVIDRASERPMLVASAAGGMEIEEVAAENPAAIIRMAIDPALGLKPFHARRIAVALGLGGDLVGKTAAAILGCYRTFIDTDASMLEINPLVTDKSGAVIALDAKMSLDENALFRHPDLEELRDKTQEDPRETYANDAGLSYVGLDGAIGCIINGAGLAMATLDMIKLAGGEPANFLDIGGAASPERVAKSFRAVLRDDNVGAILVNIFAGINRCDWVAEGIIKAIEEVSIPVPLIVRLEGTNVEQGMAILAEAKHPIIIASTLADAAEKAVAAWRGQEKRRANA
jgi:malate-CoA ligase subunit beta